ncbi:MAG: protein-glutamate O-methyltransferase CheR [Tepidisphaeraceae bacterium]|jgi:chemotaxis protein methyltransferase CheR
MPALIPDNISDRDFQFISDLVHDHCGINLHGGKKELVQARLTRCLRQSGCSTVAEYLAQVRDDSTGGELAGLTDAISTNLTSFFREASHFDHLRAKFLPVLLENKRTTGSRRIRAWSAGCSTGEEPYSIAITLLEALGRDAGWDAKLLATDISRPVLEQATRGAYEPQRLSAMPAILRDRYFRETRCAAKPTYQAAELLRQMIRFNHLNLMADWPFKGAFDFIFCRNVMIYFDKPTQQKLVNRFWQCLAPGGLLFTGHSESLTGVSHKFRYVLPTIYAR